MKERILFEDNHLIAVNKLSSEIVQGDKSGDEPLSEMIKRYLKEEYRKPGNVYLGIIHRIDRPTSGAVIFAKTDKALSRMNKMLKEGEIRKIYWTVVDKLPPEQEGELVHYLVRNRKQNKSYASAEKKRDSKLARLSYKVLGATNRYYMLEIELHTGRHHQIRAQLAAVGCRIKGDMKYGFPRSNKGGGIYLHSRRIVFQHPVKKELVKITAPVPVDPLWNVFEQH
ncbi:MAG: RNA pseudouridine synthase [Spirochaetes bacterium]|nr:MAG: RNA pseudouridine synthase [Spirochaetota bacterium]